LDNDCNGTAEDGCLCDPGQTLPCYDGPPHLAGVGVCVMGTMTCLSTGEDVEWGPCEGDGQPQEVICGGGRDYRCTGIIDEGCPCQRGATVPCYDGPAGTEGRGLCRAGVSVCDNPGGPQEWSACQNQVTPVPEPCDGQDHDCDGIPNTGCGCQVGAVESCYEGRAGTQGVGVCRAGTHTCEQRANGSAWGPCNGQTLPTVDRCDNQDWDCDGTPNTSCVCILGTTQTCYDGPAGTLGVGVCHGGNQMCVARPDGNGAQWGPCNGQVTPGQDLCDGVDRTCTGVAGVGCACVLGANQACYTGPANTRGRGICHEGNQTCQVVGGTLRWGSCGGEQTPMATDQCANHLDDNCNGETDEGCTGALTCPGDQTVMAGSPLALSASGVGITSYTWTVEDGPVGGPATVVWTPSPPTSSSESFVAYIVGVYTIRVSGRDAQGTTHSCTFRVTAQSHGLRLELSWDGTGDVDLHLHNGSNTPWFGTGDDCYYAHMATTWGAGLDVDNVTANGPENIRIDNPVNGQDYTIGVHNYARAAGRVATVKVFCGTTAGVTPTHVFTSRALTGTASGNCTANDFWRVARIRFTSASSCTVTNINTYTTSNNACSGL
jgi:hypothetical protein